MEGKRFMVGDSLTLADIELFEIFQRFLVIDGKQVREKFPNLVRFYENFEK